MRKVLAAAFMISIWTSLAAAQAPASGNVFLGYSYLNTDVSSTGRSNINGWEASLEGKVSRFASAPHPTTFKTSSGLVSTEERSPHA